MPKTFIPIAIHAIHCLPLSSMSITHGAFVSDAAPCCKLWRDHFAMASLWRLWLRYGDYGDDGTVGDYGDFGFAIVATNETLLQLKGVNYLDI